MKRQTYRINKVVVLLKMKEKKNKDNLWRYIIIVIKDTISVFLLIAYSTKRKT